jgi:hypothetical protein
LMSDHSILSIVLPRQYVAFCSPSQVGRCVDNWLSGIARGESRHAIELA